MLGIPDPEVEFRFYWRKKLRRWLPSYIGAVRVSIHAPACVTEEEIDRLVFRAPEFFENGKEIIRVDSFHYHRVTTPEATILSQKVQRNPLSFRAIQCIWRAGIFDYSSGCLKRNEIERRIRYGIVGQVEEVLAGHTRKSLPASRKLSRDDHSFSNALVLLGFPAADDKHLFDSYA